MKPTYTTQAQVRVAFWTMFPEFKKQPGKSQNDYGADIRAAFVEFVDGLARGGEITEKLADAVTL